MPFNSKSSTTTKASFWTPKTIIFAVLLIAGLVFTGYNYITYANLGARSENKIDTQYKSLQAELSRVSLTVKETLGVAKLETKALDGILKTAMEGRYGSDGEGAKQAMLWVKENYPGQYNPALYQQVQQVIIAGRTDFKQEQDLLLDSVRIYRNDVDMVWSGFWLKLAGYPRSSFKWETYAPVVSGHAKEAFETKIDKGFEIE